MIGFDLVPGTLVRLTTSVSTAGSYNKGYSKDDVVLIVGSSFFNDDCYGGDRMTLGKFGVKHLYISRNDEIIVWST